MKNRYFDDEWFMEAALKSSKRLTLLEKFLLELLLLTLRKIISSGHNLKEANNDPTGHAEIIAIKEAASKVDSWAFEWAYLICYA